MLPRSAFMPTGPAADGSLTLTITAIPAFAGIQALPNLKTARASSEHPGLSQLPMGLT